MHDERGELRFTGRRGQQRREVCQGADAVIAETQVRRATASSLLDALTPWLCTCDARP
jgi:hypothetical protein